MRRACKIGGAALVAVLLAACSGDLYDSRSRGFVPEYPDQVYPIRVVKGAVRLKIPVVSGQLTESERLAVQRLGQDAESKHTRVVIERPAGSLAAEVLAAKITQELIRAGVSPQAIVHRTGKQRDIIIRYRRKFAVTRECGDWSKPINETAINRPYPNFGCAQQHNIAAMVDNPEDFERPRVMTPPDADSRNAAMAKYRKREDYTSQWPGEKRIEIENSIKETVKR